MKKPGLCDMRAVVQVMLMYFKKQHHYLARNAARIYKSWDGSKTDVDKDIANPTNIEGARMFGLDINYFTFDVNAIQGSNMDNGADACFIRCVE